MTHLRIAANIYRRTREEEVVSLVLYSAVGSLIAVDSTGGGCRASFLIRTWLFSSSEELETLSLRMAVVHLWGSSGIYCFLTPKGKMCAFQSLGAACPTDFLI